MSNPRKLQIEQLDRKMSAFASISEPSPRGWIKAVRTALGMSYRQMAKRLKITPQSAQGFEKREMQESITIKNLHEIARSLNMRLVYGFVPTSGSLEQMIADQALAVARKIVMRTDMTMKLEDQGVTKERKDKAILDLAEEIKREMPRYLWD
jgi:predicted DNA-binding mobile mystery protein A